MKRTTGGRVGIIISTTLVIIFILAPIYWMIATSLKSPTAIESTTPSLFPNPISFENYTNVFVDRNFGQNMLNSIIVSVVATALVLLFGTLAGYALGRLPMKGRFSTLVILLIISVFPIIALIVPLFAMMRTIDWLNSYQALIVPYTALNLPFAIWILRNYFVGVPKEMEETARIDGAGPLRTLFTVVLPMALPGLFTAGIFAFTACWAEFLMSLTFNSDTNLQTIPVAISLFSSPHQVPYGPMMAASAASVVPIAILVLIFRKSVVSGLTSGAVKG